MAQEGTTEDAYFLSSDEIYELLPGNSLIYKNRPSDPFGWFLRPEGTGLKLDIGRISEICWGSNGEGVLCLWHPDVDYEAPPCWRLARWAGQDGSQEYGLGWPQYLSGTPVLSLEHGDVFDLESRFEGPRALTPAICGRL